MCNNDNEFQVNASSISRFLAFHRTGAAGEQMGELQFNSYLGGVASTVATLLGGGVSTAEALLFAPEVQESGTSVLLERSRLGVQELL